MKHALGSLAFLASVLVVFAGGCTSGSAPIGQECTESGGVCTTAECEEGSLPYPCNGSAQCCVAPEDGGK